MDGNSTHDNSVTNNYIGLDKTGANALPNANGVVLSGQSNTIGGTHSFDANVISGNTTTGFGLEHNANLNRIESNIIGLDADQLNAVPNGNTSEFALNLPVQNLATNVTSQVTITRGVFRYNRASGHYTQTLTLKNTGSAVTGPVTLALDNLQNATLIGSSGVTVATTPAGSPLKLVTAGNMAANAVVSVTLEFSNPSNGTITYATRVLAGAGYK